MTGRQEFFEFSKQSIHVEITINFSMDDSIGIFIIHQSFVDCLSLLMSSFNVSLCTNEVLLEKFIPLIKSQAESEVTKVKFEFIQSVRAIIRVSLIISAYSRVSFG